MDTGMKMRRRTRRERRQESTVRWPRVRRMTAANLEGLDAVRHFLTFGRSN